MTRTNPCASSRSPGLRATALRLLAVVSFASVLACTGEASAQTTITAVARPGATPAWNKGMRQIDTESYYHAVECGKQGGEDPPCVFWDTGICKNDDFTLSFYSGYKQVAYAVWTAVRKKQPPPQPSYQSARQTRVTVGIAPASGSKNRLTGFVLKRGGKPAPPSVRDVADGGGQFTFDYAPWAPTASVTLEMVGKTRTIACVIPMNVLQQFR